MKNNKNKAIFINPFTDFGFKKLFGQDLLMDFLKVLLGSQIGKIVDIKFLKNENIGSTSLDRKAIFDLYCTNEKAKDL